MMDEPDERSTTVFNSQAGDRVRHFSSLIAQHNHMYQNPSEIEPPLEGDLDSVKQLMANYQEETSKMRQEVDQLFIKLSQLNDTISERIEGDMKETDTLVSRARQIRTSNYDANERAREYAQLNADSENARLRGEQHGNAAEKLAKSLEKVRELRESLDTIRRVAYDASEEAKLAREQVQIEKRAEEERELRREQEQKKAAEDAKKRIEEERRREIEKQRIAEEMAKKEALASGNTDAVTARDIANNPTYWPSYTYGKSPNFFDRGISVIIRAFPHDITQDMVQVEEIEQSESGLDFSEGEELLSGIYQLTYKDEETSDRLSAALSILMPHCGTRLPTYREPVVKYCSSSGKWREVTTKEVSLNEYRDLPFVECRMKPLGKFAVVARIKHDVHCLHPHAHPIVSNIDSRFSLEFRPSTVRIPTKLIIKVC